MPFYKVTFSNVRGRSVSLTVAQDEETLSEGVYLADNNGIFAAPASWYINELLPEDRLDFDACTIESSP